MSMYQLRRADRDDFDTVAGLITERAAWLARQGFEQWSSKDPVRGTASTIDSGATWLLVDGTGSSVGTLTMTTEQDWDFWYGTDTGFGPMGEQGDGPSRLHVAPCIYLSKLATRVDQSGQGLGRVLIEAAARYALNRGISKLRWDVWRTNTHLQDYYRRLGATLLRVVEIPGRHSGALFELDAAVVAEGKAAVTIDAPHGALTMPNQHFYRDTYTIGWGGDLDDLPLDTKTIHYKLHELTWEAWAKQGVAVTVNEDSAPTVLHFDGLVWRLNGEHVIGDATNPLHPGLPYQLVYSNGRAVIVGDVFNGDRQLQSS